MALTGITLGEDKNVITSSFGMAAAQPAEQAQPMQVAEATVVTPAQSAGPAFGFPATDANKQMLKDYNDAWKRGEKPMVPKFIR